MSPTGVDESWGRADWAGLKAAGVQAVSLYLSHDPTKNAKPADILAAHKHGIAIILNWEAFPGAPLNGAAQGTADATAWLAQRDALVTAVGYGPRNKLGAYFSCDRDITAADFPKIDAYYAATKTVLGGRALNGVYGERTLVEHLHGNGLTDCEWQTLAWSNGVSPFADFYQSAINQHLAGGSVDFDQIIHADQIGAWWPPGHRFDRAPLVIPPPTPGVLEPLDMVIFRPNGKTYQYPILVTGATASTLTDHQSVLALIAAGAKVVQIPAVDFARIQKAAVK